MSTTKHNDVTLTAAGEREMARIDVDGDGIISTEEARAAAMPAAELRASNSPLWKIVFGVFALLFLSWLGNAGPMVAVVSLTKGLKFEGGSLKNTDGGSVSTHNQKTKYSVTHDFEKNATESLRRARRLLRLGSPARTRNRVSKPSLRRTRAFGVSSPVAG